MCLLRTFGVICFVLYIVIGSVAAYFIGGVIGVLYVTNPNTSHIVATTQKAVINGETQIIDVNSHSFVSWGFVGVLVFLGANALIFLTLWVIKKVFCGVVTLPITVAKHAIRYGRYSRYKKEEAEEMMAVDSAFLFSA